MISALDFIGHHWLALLIVIALLAIAGLAVYMRGPAAIAAALLKVLAPIGKLAAAHRQAVAIAILAIAIAIAGLLYAHASGFASGKAIADKELADTRAALAMAEGNNTANVAKAREIAAELATCTAIKTLAASTSARLAADADSFEHRITSDLAMAAKQRSAIYATPACVSATTPICPAAEHELRSRQSRLNGAH